MGIYGIRVVDGVGRVSPIDLTPDELSPLPPGTMLRLPNEVHQWSKAAQEALLAAAAKPRDAGATAIAHPGEPLHIPGTL